MCSSAVRCSVVVAVDDLERGFNVLALDMPRGLGCRARLSYFLRSFFGLKRGNVVIAANVLSV